MHRSILLAGLFVSVAGAGTITYIEQGTTTGSLNGVGFSNAVTTLTMVGDTANVFGLALEPIFINMVGTFTFNISGVGSGTFTDSLAVLDNQNTSVAGFSDFTESLLIMSTSNSAFASYALTTAIGPITGMVFANNPIGTFPTSAGTLVLSSASGNSTFTAIIGAPEPFSGSLLAVGLAALLGVRRFSRLNVIPKGSVGLRYL